MNTKYPSLFKPLKLGNYELKNRIVALPVHTGFAYPDGRVSCLLMDFTSKLAESGAAMIIVANASIAQDGAVSKFNLRIDKDEFIPGLARLAKVIKKNGAVACLQLNHAGRFAKTKQPLLPSPIDSSNLSFNISSLKGFMEFFPLEKRFGLSSDFLQQINTWRRAMNTKDCERIIKDFKNAAFRAYKAGFDMIELHGANGYLLCQFLSPFTNKIASGFGGDFQARTIFPLTVIREIKKHIPQNFPIGFRLMLREWVPGGIELPEALSFAKLLEKQDIAYLSASVGSYNSIFSPSIVKKMASPGYLINDMEQLTTKVNIPTIISGRIITPGLGNKIIKKNIASLIGLGRPLRADVQWVKKAWSGNKIIPCKNCNWCIKRIVLEQGFNCRQWPEILRKKIQLEQKMLTRNYRGLWVVSNINDIQILKNSLPLIIPDNNNIKTAISPTILLLKQENKDFNLKSRDFIDHARTALNNLGFWDAPLNIITRKPEKDYAKQIHNEIIQGNHGLVFIGADKSQLWRKRLLHKERGKVVGILNPNKYQNKVIVPVDLSDVTLLIMMFIRQTHMGKKGFDFHFVHVVTQSSNYVEKKWQEFKKIAGIDQNIGLELISSKQITPAIVKKIYNGKYGTVIMGKHGLSSIKRWLLGSVSAGVLKSLTDQSLLLID